MNEPTEVAADRTTLTITKEQPKILAWFEAIGRTEEHTHVFDWPEGEEDPRAHVAKQLVEYALRHDKSLREHPSGAFGGTPIVLAQAYLDERPTAFVVTTYDNLALSAYADVTENEVVADHAAYLRALMCGAKTMDADGISGIGADIKRLGDLYSRELSSLLRFAAERARLEKIRKAQSDVDVNKNDPPNHRITTISSS